MSKLPQCVLSCELFTAQLTLMCFDVVVDRLDVVLQVVGLLECPLAHCTLEWPQT